MSKQVYNWNADKNRFLDRFAEKMQKWGRHGVAPELLDQDMTMALDLQRDRLKEKGIETSIDYVPITMDYKKDYKWKDEKYSFKKDFRQCKRTQSYMKSGKNLCSYKDTGMLTTVTTFANYEEAVADDPYYCPSCGAVTKVKNLKEGCEYCGKQFRVSDLFPKITNFIFERNFLKINQNAPQWIIALAYVVSFIFMFFQIRPEYIEADSPWNILTPIIESAIVSIFLAVIIYFVINLAIFGYIVLKLIARTPTFFRTAATGHKITKVISKYNPAFSYEKFVGHVVSMIRMIIFTKDVNNLSAYEGDFLDDEYRNIIESTYNGRMGVKNIEIDGNYAKIDLEVFMTNTYCKNEKIKRKNEIFKVSLSKNISIPETFKFSVLAVTCKSCGGNFSSATQKICPFCGSGYDFRDDDWMITAIEK